MQVQNSSASAALLNAQAAKAAQATRTNVADDEKATSQTSAIVSSATDRSTSNGVTGTTGSRLSAETTAELIKSAQETNTANANLDNYNGPLSIGERHHLEDIANDPAYAASEAKRFGTFIELVRVGGPMSDVNKMNLFSEENQAKIKARMANAKQVQGVRTTYYESLKGQDLTPAETYAKLLEFNVNLPPSHDTALGWSEFGRSMSYSDYNQTRLDYLRQAITQVNSHKPTSLTETA